MEEPSPRDQRGRQGWVWGQGFPKDEDGQKGGGGGTAERAPGGGQKMLCKDVGSRGGDHVLVNTGCLAALVATLEPQRSSGEQGLQTQITFV